MDGEGSTRMEFRVIARRKFFLFGPIRYAAQWRSDWMSFWNTFQAFECPEAAYDELQRLRKCQPGAGL